MTPVGRIFRNFLERLLGRFHEGPRLPARFLETAEDFRTRFAATEKDWAAFAVGLAQAAYRDGYVRGFECSERWEKPWARTPTPDQIADAEEEDWRSSPPHRWVE
jgi:hypothetical protein